MTKPARVLVDSLNPEKWLDAAFTADEIDDVAVSTAHADHPLVRATAAAINGADYEFSAVHGTTIYYVYALKGQLVGLLHPEDYTEQEM